MNKVNVKFKEANLSCEEKLDILVSGVCKSVFPLSIIHKDNMIFGYYKTDGYKRVSAFENLTERSILILLEKLIIAMEEASQYLLFPEDYIINGDTVYVGENFDAVKIIFIPDCSNYKVMTKMKNFVHELSNHNPLTKDIYCNFINHLESDNGSFLYIKYAISKIFQDIQ